MLNTVSLCGHCMCTQCFHCEYMYCVHSAVIVHILCMMFFCCSTGTVCEVFISVFLLVSWLLIMVLGKLVTDADLFKSQHLSVGNTSSS